MPDPKSEVSQTAAEWRDYLSSFWPSPSSEKGTNRLQYRITLPWKIGGGVIEDPTRCYDDIQIKAQRIERCLAAGESGGRTVDLWELRELALSKGGLLKPKYRKRAWSMLVGLEEPYAAAQRTTQSGAETGANVPSRSAAGKEFAHLPGEEKKTDAQDASLDLIRRDVGRSVVFRYNKYEANSIPDLAEENASVSSVMTTPNYASDRLAYVLEHIIRASSAPPPSSLRHPSSPSRPSQRQQQPQQQQRQPYHYYQGLHDVAGVVLHQLDYQQNLGIAILERLAQSHWRDALRENFGNLTWILNHMWLPLLEKVEPNIHGQLQLAQVEMSNLTLPWMITWFTHDVFHAETAGRLADAFLAGHPSLPLYFGVALVSHPLLQSSILQSDPNDPASLFLQMKQFPRYLVSDLHDSTSSQIPPAVGEDVILDDSFASQPQIPVQEVLDDALAIMRRLPPRSLLNLIDSKVLSRNEVLHRANSISLFKAASSWNLASDFVVPPNPLASSLSASFSSIPTSLQPSTADPSSTSSLKKINVFVRAKVASGVPLLMETASTATCWKQTYWGSRRYPRAVLASRPKRKRRTPKAILRKWRKLLFGK